MLPCTLMRRLSFLLWYTSLQFLLVYVFDELVVNSTMRLGFVAVATQIVWLMCTYLFAVGLGVYTQFTSAVEEQRLDDKTRESEARGEQPRGTKEVASTAENLLAVGLSMLLVVILANWFALFACIAGTMYPGGNSMIRSLWGSTGAWVCVWVIFIMQSQLLASTYVISTHYTQVVPLSTGLQMSVSLYSVCHALLLLSVCARAYEMEEDPICVEGGNKATLQYPLSNFTPSTPRLVQPAQPCGSAAERASQAIVMRYWLPHIPAIILLSVAVICVAADFIVNAFVLRQTFLLPQRAAPPDKRYLKIGLLWISLFSALVILCTSDLSAYVFVVLFPPLTLVFFISWHNYKTLEAPSFFAKKPKTTYSAKAKPFTVNADLVYRI